MASFIRPFLKCTGFEMAFMDNSFLMNKPLIGQGKGWMVALKESWSAAQCPSGILQGLVLQSVL